MRILPWSRPTALVGGRRSAIALAALLAGVPLHPALAAMTCGVAATTDVGQTYAPYAGWRVISYGHVSANGASVTTERLMP